MNNLLFSLLLFFCFSLTSQAVTIAEKDWGLATGLRIAKVPYPAEKEQVTDFIPQMYYDGDYFFMNGLNGGLRLYNKQQWQFSLFARYRYVDIPEEFQTIVQTNSLDAGVQIKYRLADNLETNIELLSDNDSRVYSAVDARYRWQSGSWQLLPYATLRFKSARFNDYYYGLDGFIDPDNPANNIDNKIGNGLDLTIGSEVRYHVSNNFYLLGAAQLTTLDRNTRNPASIKNATVGEVYFGIAIFNNKTKTKSPSLKAKPYFRVAYGFATPSDLSEILSLNWEGDPQNNQMTSLFYGHPIADSLFGNEAIDLYLTTGIVRHLKADPYSQTLYPGEGINSTEFSGLDSSPCDGVSACTINYNSQPSNEYVLGIKAYYNINWPLHWRVGFAEGLSYIKDVSHIEQREMDTKGYTASSLINYIDLTFDFSLGDAFGVTAINDLYFGIGIHHRSSVFEISSSFGRIKGGSNYNSMHLQYHF